MNKYSSGDIYIKIGDSLVNSQNTVKQPEKEDNEVKYDYYDKLIRYNYDTGETIHQNPDGTIHYKGGWNKDSPNGWGTVYNKNGDIEYEGIWNDGILQISPLQQYFYKEDIVQVCYEDGTIRYHGKWKKGQPNGKPNGIGSYYSKEGDIVLRDVQWVNGYSKLSFQNLYFEYESGMKVEIVDGKIWYRGEFSDGHYCGKGTSYTLSNQKSYEGEWKNGKPHGQGCYYRNDKIVYKGKWINGYHHIAGWVWYSYSYCKKVNFVPFQDSKIPKWMKNAKCIENIEDSKTIYCTKLLWLFIPILAVFLLYTGFFFFSWKVTVHNALELSLPKPFLTQLTIGEKCGKMNKKHIDISNYRCLKTLIVEKNTYQNVYSITIENNPLLETIEIQKYGFGMAPDHGCTLIHFGDDFILRNLPSLVSFIVGPAAIQNMGKFHLIDLPKLNYLSFGAESFHVTAYVELIHVPFENGIIQKGSKGIGYCFGYLYDEMSMKLKEQMSTIDGSCKVLLLNCTDGKRIVNMTRVTGAYSGGEAYSIKYKNQTVFPKTENFERIKHFYQVTFCRGYNTLEMTGPFGSGWFSESYLELKSDVQYIGTFRATNYTTTVGFNVQFHVYSNKQSLYFSST